MHGLGFDPSQLYDRLAKLDTAGLSFDGLEKCREVIPTEEEVKQLAAYRGDVEKLRDVERRLYKLAFLGRLPQRLQLMTFELQLDQWSVDIREDIGTLIAAAGQVKSSMQLRTVLRVVLLLGNFVNHGSTKSKQTKGFTVESLAKLAELKSPVSPSVTMLHYVAYRVVGGMSLQDAATNTICEELHLIKASSRIAIEEIRGKLDALGSGIRVLASEIKLSAKYDEEVVGSLKRLQARAESELEELTARFSVCESALLDLQHFFGEDPKKRNATALFVALGEFVHAFSKAAAELQRHPARFQDLCGAPSHAQEEEMLSTAISESRGKQTSSPRVMVPSDSLGGPASGQGSTSSELKTLRRCTSS